MQNRDNHGGTYLRVVHCAHPLQLLMGKCSQRYLLLADLALRSVLCLGQCVLDGTSACSLPGAEAYHVGDMHAG